MTTMLAYLNDPALKKQTLAKIEQHRVLDQIVQGIYWDEDQHAGCAVGCLLEDPGGGHDRYETEFGIPVQLSWLEDSIFEALPIAKAREWPSQFMAAIPVGANLISVWPRFAVWLMTDDTYGLAHMTEAEDVKAICLRVADAYSRIANGIKISDEEAKAITDAARATRDARDARAARAAWTARDAWTARAAWTARDAWTARAARAASAEFVAASADKLIELLRVPA